jgi:hypothetical protein
VGECKKMALGSGEGSGHFWVNCDKGEFALGYETVDLQLGLRLD